MYGVVYYRFGESETYIKTLKSFFFQIFGKRQKNYISLLFQNLCKSLILKHVQKCENIIVLHNGVWEFQISWKYHTTYNISYSPFKFFSLQQLYISPETAWQQLKIDSNSPIYFPITATHNDIRISNLHVVPPIRSAAIKSILVREIFVQVYLHHTVTTRWRSSAVGCGCDSLLVGNWNGCSAFILSWMLCMYVSAYNYA